MKNRHNRVLTTVLSLSVIVSGLSGCTSGNIVNPGGSSDETVWNSSLSDDTSLEDVSSDDGSSRSDRLTHTIRFQFSNAEFQNPENQSVEEGELAVSPEIPAHENDYFLGWFREGSTAYPYDFTTPVRADVSLIGVFYAKDSDETDIDSDGLPDALESVLGTKEDSSDTDGDGLFDGLEYLRLHLNPLNKDTDGNGTEDGAEDTDGDGLTNAEELQKETAPEYADSDFDDLSDYEELNTYQTDPVTDDTDSDGVTDGLEVAIGTDPLKMDSSFETKWEKAEVSEEHPVSVEVTAFTDSVGAGSLSVREITSTNFPALTPSSVGYLAPCYEIETEGQLQEAVLSFYYDESLGEGKEGFDPVLYWYNEEESELVEVPGQIRENGCITATVSHFSIYGIFNRFVMDEIRIPLSWLPDGTLKDENNDSLPDIIAEYLNDGRLLYDNSYLLYMITDIRGDSDDWDGDGLKNGEEIEAAVTLSGNLKILIHSNPIVPDSDGDGLSDYDEVSIYGTSPMRFNKTPLDAKKSLESNSKYSYVKGTESFANDFVLNCDWDRKEKAKRVLINYLYDYAPEDATDYDVEVLKERLLLEDSIKYIGLISDLTKLAKNTADLYNNEEKIQKRKDLPYPEIYSDGKDIKKDMLDAVNDAKYDAITAEIGKLDLPNKLQKNIDKISEDDQYEQISGMTGLISSATGALKMCTKYQTSYDMDFTDYFVVFDKSQKATKMTPSKFAKNSLSVACDVVEGAEKVLEAQYIYSKIRANIEAYQRYYDMLTYIEKNAKDDFVRSAAGDLARMVLDTEGEYMNQLGAACVKEGLWAAANVAMDLSNKNPYVAIVQTFLEVAKITGVNELEESSINCRTMRAVSDACRSELSWMTNEESNTFNYSADKETVTKVNDYLVQLAQSRIMGEYYFYEYVAEDTSLASKFNQVLGGEKASPEKYREMGKQRIKGVYDDANRLHLKLSHNLPYYGEFYKENLSEEPIIPEDDKILAAAAGRFDGFRSAGYWTDTFTVEPDGTFSGIAGSWDNARGKTEDGTEYYTSIYEEAYLGKFMIESKLDDHSWTLKMKEYEDLGSKTDDSSMNGSKPDELLVDGSGKSYYVDEGRRIVYDYDSWLKGAKEIILYAPNTPVSELKSYDPYIRDELGTGDYLGRYAIGVMKSSDYGVIFLGERGKKYSSYSAAYADILRSKQYKDLGQDFGTQEEIHSMIRDLDQDGIPELILTNGYTARHKKHTYIYTFKDSRIRFLGNGPSITCAYLDDSKYRGLFLLDELYVIYYYKDGDNILQEKVCGGEGVSYTEQQITEDDELMKAFSDSYQNGTLRYFPEPEPVKKLGFVREKLTATDAITEWDVYAISKLMGVDLANFDGYQLEYITTVDLKNCTEMVESLKNAGCTTIVFDLGDPMKFKSIQKTLAEKYPELQIVPQVL